ncbi:MAG: nucleotidyl transferase AbiEii/AbiGii toxin family protein [Planctomycetota bacterium]
MSQKVGINTGLVEKDYWVTHVLWGLTELGLQVWFKGGTSLSKGYGLIQRFSEDLDLLVDGSDLLPKVKSWTSAGAARVAERRAYFQGLAELLTRIPDIDQSRVEQTPIDEKWRGVAYQVHYPGAFKSQLRPLMRPYVLLEVGHARVRPCEDRAISSWVHDHLTRSGLIERYRDNRAFGIRCVHPIVTLLEKLEAISRRFERGDDPASFVRHFEDAAKIIRGSDDLPDLLQGNRGLYAEMRAKRDLRRDLEVQDPAFNPAATGDWDEVRSACNDIGLMFWGERIALDDCCRLIRDWIDEHLAE